MWTYLIMGLALILLGMAVHLLKWHFLISGYNTMSREKKANVDAEGLGRFVGFYLYLNGCVLVFLGILNAIDIWTGMTPFLIVISLSTIYLLIRAQRFDHNLFDEKGKLRKGAWKKMILPGAIVLSIFLAVGGLLSYVARPVRVTVTEEDIQIRGIYGETYLRQSLERVELRDELPRIEMRTNGAAVGTNLKGHFRTTELGRVTFFVNTARPPFIYLYHDEGVAILNTGSAESTRELFESIIR